MQIEIDGLTGLMAKLKHLGGSVDVAIDKGLAKGAQAVKRDARSICPYDNGNLKQSISTEKISDGVYSVGSNLEYAVCVEYGTGSKGDPAVSHTSKEKWVYRDEEGKFHTARPQPPRPFLHPALIANESYIYKSVQVELLRAIKKEMGK